MNETKARILDVAERLLAEQGTDASLRAITAEAGVNLAAVNYHFQSKEALWEAIIARRFEPVNTKRLEMLRALEAATPSGPLPLEGVLEAFLGPLIDASENAPEYSRSLMGRLYSMPDELLKRVMGEQLAPMAETFTHAFARAVPGLPRAECNWRLIFAIGALVHVLNLSKLLPIVSSGRVDPADHLLKRRIIAFAAAGFRAPHEAQPMEALAAGHTALEQGKGELR